MNNLSYVFQNLLVFGKKHAQSPLIHAHGLKSSPNFQAGFDQKLKENKNCPKDYSALVNQKSRIYTDRSNEYGTPIDKYY